MVGLKATGTLPDEPGTAYVAVALSARTAVRALSSPARTQVVPFAYKPDKLTVKEIRAESTKANLTSRYWHFENAGGGGDVDGHWMFELSWGWPRTFAPYMGSEGIHIMCDVIVSMGDHTSQALGTSEAVSFVFDWTAMFDNVVTLYVANRYQNSLVRAYVVCFWAVLRKQLPDLVTRLTIKGPFQANKHTLGWNSIRLEVSINTTINADRVALTSPAALSDLVDIFPELRSLV